IELPKEFLYYATLLKVLYIGLESITFKDGGTITKKEIKIKYLRDAYEFTNYGTQMEIYISNKHDNSITKNLQNPNSSINDTNWPEDHKFNDVGFEEQLSLLKEVWIHINTTLDRIFGYGSILKSSNKEHRRYLKLIFELQNCELLNLYKELIKLWVRKAESTFGTFNNDNDQTLQSKDKISSVILYNCEDEIIESSNVTNDIIEFNENLSDSDLEKIKRDLIE
ncbi:24973_t:CDS:2, partial [Gigaspora margarita]